MKISKFFECRISHGTIFPFVEKKNNNTVDNESPRKPIDFAYNTLKDYKH